MRTFKVQNSDGDVREAPEDKLSEAANDGYLPAVTNGKDIKRVDFNNLSAAEKDGFVPLKNVQQYVEENKGIKGALKVGGGQFIDEALGGIPEIAADNLQSAEEKAKREALKDEFSGVNTAAGLAGFGTSFLWGGPLAKAAGTAAKAVSKPVARALGETATKGIGKAITKGAELATEGAVFTAPQAITEAITGNPEASVERILAGGAGNIIFGTIAKKGADLLKKTPKAAQDTLENIAEKEAGRSYGVTGDKQFEIGPTKAKRVNRMLLDNEGFVEFGAKDVQKAKKIEDTMKKVGDARKELYKEADQHGRINLDELKNRILKENGNFERGSDLMKQENALLESVFQAIDQRKSALTPQQSGKIARDALEEVVNFSKYKDPKLQKTLIQNAMARPEIKERVMQKIKENTDKFKNSVKFSEVQDLIEKEIANTAEFDSTRASKLNDFAKSIYGTTRSFLNEESDKILRTVDPKLAGAINQTNKKFENLYTLKNGIEEKRLKTAKRDESDSIVGTAIRGAKDFANTYVRPLGIKAADKTAQIIENLRNTELLGKQIPKILSEGSNRGKAPLMGKLSDFTANDLEKMNDSLTELKQNPESPDNPLSEQVAELAKIDPRAAALLAQKTGEIADYVQNAIPKNPNDISTPFRQKTWRPSDLELNKFKRVYQAAIDPVSVIHDLSTGVINNESVKTVRDLYPQLSKDVDQALIEYLDQNPKIPYIKKQKIQTFLQGNYLSEYDPKNINQLQQNLLSKPTKQDQPQQSINKSVNVPDLSTNLDKSIKK